MTLILIFNVVNEVSTFIKFRIIDSRPNVPFGTGGPLCITLLSLRDLSGMTGLWELAKKKCATAPKKIKICRRALFPRLSVKYCHFVVHVSRHKSLDIFTAL